jgi:hypothetical protein
MVQVLSHILGSAFLPYPFNYWVRYGKARIGRLVIQKARSNEIDAAKTSKRIFRTIPNTFGLAMKSLSDRQKLDFLTLKVLTISSYVTCKLFGHKKAVPHRTERRS